MAVRKNGVREGDTREERERLPERLTKIVVSAFNLYWLRGSRGNTWLRWARRLPVKVNMRSFVHL